MRRKRRITALTVPLVALGLAVAGCSDDDSDSATDETTVEAPAPLALSAIEAST